MKKKIETIFTHGEGTLGIDNDSILYWNGQPIVTEQKIKLQGWVNVSIIIASLSTFAIALIAVLQYFY